jgi:fatty acid CoA ligase FadD36
LLDHPAVAEVAVVGSPDDDLGQRIVAFVVIRPDEDIKQLSSLTDFVADHLSPHKCPRDIQLVEQLPRNAMGKVQKKQLLALIPPPPRS